MKVIVGLGNPGPEYASTRHNVGFMTVDALAEKYAVTRWKNQFEALVGECQIGDEKVLLVKPQTYMNLSGKAVGPLMRWYKTALQDMAVVHDDMDLLVGTARIRKKGGSGGHNGIKSLLAELGAEDFARFRIGIGRPPQRWTVIDYVLAKFSDEDRKRAREAIEKIVPALECFAQYGIDLAMNRYNPSRERKKRPQETAAEEKTE